MRRELVLGLNTEVFRFAQDDCMEHLSLCVFHMEHWRENLADVPRGTSLIHTGAQLGHSLNLIP